MTKLPILLLFQYFIYTYLLALRAIASLLPPTTASISQRWSQGKYCCRGGQLTCYRPNSPKIGIISKKILFVGDADLFDGKQIKTYIWLWIWRRNSDYTWGVSSLKTRESNATDWWIVSMTIHHWQISHKLFHS